MKDFVHICMVANVVVGVPYMGVGIAVLIFAMLGAGNGDTSMPLFQIGGCLLAIGAILLAAYFVARVLTHDWNRSLPWWAWLFLYQFIFMGLIVGILGVFLLVVGLAKAGEGLEEQTGDLETLG